MLRVPFLILEFRILVLENYCFANAPVVWHCTFSWQFFVSAQYYRVSSVVPSVIWKPELKWMLDHHRLQSECNPPDDRGVMQFSIFSPRWKKVRQKVGRPRNSQILVMRRLTTLWNDFCSPFLRKVVIRSVLFTTERSISYSLPSQPLHRSTCVENSE